jgi:hypothetical protein
MHRRELDPATMTTTHVATCDTIVAARDTGHADRATYAATDATCAACTIPDPPQ